MLQRKASTQRKKPSKSHAFVMREQKSLLTSKKIYQFLEALDLITVTFILININNIGYMIFKMVWMITI